MRMLALTVAVIFSLVVLVPPASAQSSTFRHAASSGALDSLVQQHLDSVAADRAAVAALLARPEIEKIAGGAGLDLQTARSAVASLSAQELAQLASQARQAERGLAGGASTVTISTTTIIIGLLVLILLIVALR